MGIPLPQGRRGGQGVPGEGRPRWDLAHAANARGRCAIRARPGQGCEGGKCRWPRAGAGGVAAGPRELRAG